MKKNTIQFYGASWCADCRRSKAYLDDKSIKYEYINIDEIEGAAEKVVEINKGLRSIPTIVFPNGKVLAEPSNAELAVMLGENNL